jgi:hypothetical protein
MSMKNSNDTIGYRSRDLLVCSSVPQPLRHHVPHTLLLLYLMLVMSSVHNAPIKLYCIYVYYMNIMLYIAFGIIHGFTSPRQALERITRGYWGTAVFLNL